MRVLALQQALRIQWLAHAKSDLRITQICRSDSGVLPNQTVFHAQQAAEKAIKAVLLEHKIRYNASTLPSPHFETLSLRQFSSGRLGLL